MKTYAMMILGCKVNDYEAHSLKEKMNQDYKEVSFKDSSDIYIIFSCCVTNVAEAKTRKFIHGARRRNPKAYIVVVGCYAQTKSEEKVFEDVDLIVGSKYKDHIKDYIDEALKANKVEDLDDVNFENLSLREYQDKTRAFLKIQDGCNQFCSYCIIPYARGHERSAKLNDIVAEANILSKTSKEIVLTGIHTGRYNDSEYHLIDLLKELVKIEALETIRLSSIEITEITDDIIDLMANNPKIANHLHIPLQSGSNHILELMNRPYTKEEFLDRVNYIRSKVKNISISTDLIVGFPNETDEDFKETINFIKDIKFSFMHIFPYSRKSNTKADKMEGHLVEHLKKERAKAISDIQKEISLGFDKSFINKNVKVLVERCHNGISFGHSKEYLMIQIEKELKTNEIYDVRIISVNNGIIKGEITNVA